jgi:CRISPR system Cascade subunit CasE
MSPLHFVRLPLSIPALGRWAAERNLGWSVRRNIKGQERDAGLDEGRALHHLLTESFGQQAFSPFRLFVAPQARQGHVYAYSRADRAQLLEVAGACAMPENLAVFDLQGLATKTMPESWRVGQRIGFEVRVRPVSRLLKPLPSSDGSFAKGAELDTFLVEALRRFPSDSASQAKMLPAGRTREAVYTDWLARKLADAATLAPGVRLTRFERNRAARTASSIEGPDATLQGDLTIQNPEGFQNLLAGGIGRHKAYGYGMLLLRPAKNPCPAHHPENPENL